MYIRDRGSAGPSDPKRPVVKSVEATYVRPTKQREAACVTIDSYIQAGIFCDVLYVLARDKCTDSVVILIICFVFNELLFIYIYC